MFQHWVGRSRLAEFLVSRVCKFSLCLCRFSKLETTPLRMQPWSQAFVSTVLCSPSSYSIYIEHNSSKHFLIICIYQDNQYLKNKKNIGECLLAILRGRGEQLLYTAYGRKRKESNTVPTVLREKLTLSLPVSNSVSCMYLDLTDQYQYSAACKGFTKENVQLSIFFFNT